MKDFLKLIQEQSINIFWRNICRNTWINTWTYFYKDPQKTRDISKGIPVKVSGKKNLNKFLKKSAETCWEFSIEKISEKVHAGMSVGNSGKSYVSNLARISEGYPAWTTKTDSARIFGRCSKRTFRRNFRNTFRKGFMEQFWYGSFLKIPEKSSEENPNGN